MSFENPFTPSFGEIPVHVAGREQVIAPIVRAFESTRRRPELTTLISGARGTGKTTLLTLLARKAESLGWISVSATALPGMLEDLEIGTRRAARHLLPEEPSSHVTGVSVAPLGVISLERSDRELTNWRYRMADILDVLASAETGLLITIDEIDPTLDEMIQLAAVYQHFVQEGRKVALLMAGLPHNVSSLMSNKTVSFLRRAQSVRLGPVAPYDVRNALLSTVLEGGREIDQDALDLAAQETGGFPFLIQLVGYRVWDIRPDEPTISLSDVEHGVELALAEMEERIFEATFRDLSEGDLRFLSAMLEDEGDSKMEDLVRRMDRSSSQVAQYRRRLIEAGVIGARRRGVVGFDLPHFREFLEARI